MAKSVLPSIIVGILIAASPAAACGQPYPKANSEADTKHGAVLCAWMIYVSVEAIGRRCFPGKHEAFKAALRQSIADIEAFYAPQLVPDPDRSGPLAASVSGGQELQGSDKGLLREPERGRGQQCEVRDQGPSLGPARARDGPLHLSRTAQ